METSRSGTAAKELFAAVTEPGVGEALGLDGWLGVLSDTQEVLNVLAGVQAVAMAQVAAFDGDDSSGFGPRRHRGLGHQALDAPDLVAARVGCSAQAASTRLGVAVAQVTSMSALVAAMGSGRVDGFRAAVVADELSDAPAEVRAEVAAVLEESGRLEAETAAPLRRRTRRLLAERAPQVLAARAASERDRRGLHRSTAALGVEHWAAWLPVEASRPAWAAVTTLAQDYLRAGQADTLAQARADAMLDLILGQATASFVLHPTVPLEDLAVTGADLAEGAGRDDGDDLVPVSGYGTPGQSFIRRGHLRELAGLTGHGRRTRSTRRGEGSAARGATRVRVGECLALDPDTGATVGVVDPASGEVDPATDVVDPGTGAVDRRRGRSGTLRPIGRQTATGLEPGQVAAGSGSGSAFVRVPENGPYRPAAEVERMVKARDGQCRFPGCQVPVRFCDLDHVQAFDHDDPLRAGDEAVEPGVPVPAASPGQAAPGLAGCSCSRTGR